MLQLSPRFVCHRENLRRIGSLVPRPMDYLISTAARAFALLRLIGLGFVRAEVFYEFGERLDLCRFVRKPDKQKRPQDVAVYEKVGMRGNGAAWVI